MPRLVINTSTQGYDTKEKGEREIIKRENLTLLMKTKKGRMPGQKEQGLLRESGGE